jgi:hypothetical protein
LNLELELLFVFKGTGKPAIHEAEPGPLGQRKLVVLDDQARFEGPRLRGTLMPGGTDWQLVRADGVTEIDAAYLLRTDDGVLLKVVNRGLRHAPPVVASHPADRGEVDPGTPYFRCTPTIEAPTGQYDWLNRSVYVATGVRTATGIELWFYRVC